MELYLVTDRELLLGKDLMQTVLKAAEGGVGMVQLREKECSTREFIDLAVELKRILAPLGVPLIINDRIDVALAADADGVHVGQSDMPYEMVRRLMPPGKIIGLSVESREQIIEANIMDINYIGISPVFSTPTKTDTAIEWGLEGLIWARANSRHKIVAIGGINIGNAKQIVDAGADSLAVVSAICSSDDPRQAAQDFFDIIRR